jgi:flagellar biosynthesis/type III secretory pathway chaperone
MTTSTDELSKLLAELREILEEERAILLSGSPERISGVAERKLLLADAIERKCNTPGTVPPNLETLAWLGHYNRGNSVICSAILRHLNQTIDKLRQNESHRSYGPDGAENNPAAPNPLGAA